MPHSPRRWSPLLGLLPLVALAACRDPVSASDLTGRRYALDRAGDTPLPVLMSTSQGDSTVLVADTVAFDVPPRATRTLVYRYAFRTGTHMSVVHAEMEFRLTGSHVEVGSFTRCGPTAYCAPNLGGTLGDAAMITTEGNPPSATNAPWRYGRVPDWR